MIKQKTSEFGYEILQSIDLNTLTDRCDLIAILACARVSNKTMTSEELLVHLRRVKNWREFFETARAQDAHQLVVKIIERCDHELQIPEDVWRHAINSFKSTAHRNLLLNATLIDSLEILENAGIEALGFKGPVQAILDFGDLSSRSFGDIDLYLRKADLQQAARVLRDKGFQFMDSSFESPKAVEEHLEESHELRVFESANQILIELHWSLGPKYWSMRFDPKLIFANARKPEALGGKVRTMGCEHRLLMIIVQMSKSKWSSIGKLIGIAKCVENSKELSWPRVFQLARSAGIERILNMALIQISRLVGTALPADAFRHMTIDPKTVSFCNELSAQLMSPPSADEPFDWTGTYLRSREHIGDRWPFFIKRISQLIDPDKHCEEAKSGSSVRGISGLIREYGIVKPILQLFGLR